MHSLIEEAIRPVHNIPPRRNLDLLKFSRAFFILIDEIDHAVAIFHPASLYNVVTQLANEVFAVSFDQELLFAFGQADEEVP